jgi:hypothetical protein
MLLPVIAAGLDGDAHDAEGTVCLRDLPGTIRLEK